MCPPPLPARSVDLLRLEYLITKPKSRPPAATYPKGDEIVCTTKPERNPWAKDSQEAETLPAAATSQTAFTFTQTSRPGSDAERERAERLTRKSTADFVQALLDLAK